MTSFAEERFDDGFLTLGAVGGPVFNTNVVVVNSGAESRNANWTLGRGRWDYGERKMGSIELEYIIGFFRARKGRLQGFRYKDRGDFKATKDAATRFGATTQGVFVNVSTTAAQMHKAYTSGSDTDFRKIAKPIASTIKVYKDGSLLTLTTDYTIDDTTGIVTFTSPFGTSALTWDGEFDTPVRFDVDELKYEHIAGVPAFSDPPDFADSYFSLRSLALVEIRV